ncbi:MAG: hypothetical protein IJ723_03105 [Ruminococcus sp.]|nr:hypothetical protein [Ruminococcus sp.]
MDIFTEHKRMTNAQLREYHRRLQSRRNLWLAIPWLLLVPAIIVYGLKGWSNYPMVMFGAGNGYHADPSVFGVITWIVFALLTIFLPLEHAERRFAPAILMGAYDLILLLFGAFPIDGLLMVGYYVGAAFALEPIRRELNFIRALPDFPFLERTEQDRFTELKVAEYYESSAQMQKQMKHSAPARVYDPSMTDEALSTLPKKHIEEIHISRGYFDEPERAYTDDLANAAQPVDRLSRKEIFEEPEQVYNDKVINAAPRSDHNTDYNE